jgi:hypothetical protein
MSLCPVPPVEVHKNLAHLYNDGPGPMRCLPQVPFKTALTVDGELSDKTDRSYIVAFFLTC